MFIYWRKSGEGAIPKLLGLTGGQCALNEPGPDEQAKSETSAGQYFLGSREQTGL
jgi:hypothetical protein